jgi:putative ABC transport system permease protein
MDWRGCLYLLWCYLASHRGKVAVVVVVVGLAVALPGSVVVVVDRAEERMRQRADATPLVVGRLGSPLELVMHLLYFEGSTAGPMRWGELGEIEGDGMGRALPLHVGYRAGGAPVVGTSLDYLEWRGLRVVEGVGLARLGDCLLGAEVARRLGLGPGDSLATSPESAFDLAGSYPLKMRVRGVLAETGGVEDGVVWADVKTCWTIAGLAHGHDEVMGGEGVLGREGDMVRLSAAVREYQEVTDENVASFHFHGSEADFPISGAVVLPDGERGAALLLGRYAAHESLQMLRPGEVMDGLMATVFRVRDLVLVLLGVMGAAVAVIVGLVFVLSARLRGDEVASLRRLGGSEGAVRLLLWGEGVVCLVAGLGVGVLVVWGVAAI